MNEEGRPLNLSPNKHPQQGNKGEKEDHIRKNKEVLKEGGKFQEKGIKEVAIAKEEEKEVKDKLNSNYIARITTSHKVG